MVFCLSSVALIVLFGAALGNVLRGVPLDEEGWFFLPLWTDGRAGQLPGVLDWYTVTIGVSTLAMMVMHGALWVAVKTEGDLQGRARDLARRVVAAVLGLTVLGWGVTCWVQPHMVDRFWSVPLSFGVFLAMGGMLVMIHRSLRQQHDTRVFLASCGVILIMIATAAFGLFPLLLPSSGDPQLAMTVHDAAAAQTGLRIGLAWWVPGMILVAGYFVFVYRSFSGKVRLT